MEKSLVSIILPTYNRAEFIGKALDSVLAQTYGNWECVLIDDGSTDHTRDVLAAFDDSRIRFFRQENRGVSGARNAGIAACRGDVIALLDSDDEWLPAKLETQLSYMRANGYEICQTEEIWIGAASGSTSPPGTPSPRGGFSTSLWKCA